MGLLPNLEKPRVLRKGAWTGEEDTLLRKYMEKSGSAKWSLIPQKAGINRCPKSCRLRWLNYLCPSIKRGKFEDAEKDLLIRLHKLLGNRWSLIAGRLPGRTANDVKNYWNTHLSKQLLANKFKKVEEGSSSINNNTVKVIKPQPRRIPYNWTWSNHSESFSDKHQRRQKEPREELVVPQLPPPCFHIDDNKKMESNTINNYIQNLELEMSTDQLQKDLDFGVEDIGVMGDNEFLLEGFGGGWEDMSPYTNLLEDFECI